jgi:hypothetical protein
MISIFFLFSIELIAQNPFEKFIGCYDVVDFQGRDAFARGKPQTLVIRSSRSGDYFLPDGRDLSGVKFEYCASDGPMSICSGQMAYDDVGTYGISSQGSDFFFYAGDACEPNAQAGILCGGLLESLAVKREAGMLRIQGSRHSVMPTDDSQYKAEHSALVMKRPKSTKPCH